MRNGDDNVKIDTLTGDVEQKNGGVTPSDGLPTKPVRIANLADEPDFQLKVDPLEVRFKYIAPNPAFAEIRITNITDKRQFFKIKSTNNRLFQIQPTVGFLQPNTISYIKVTMNDTATKQPENHHYIAIFHLKSTSNDVDEASKACRKSFDGVIRLRIAYDREGGAADEGTKTIGN
ncbi:unnamed protein product [Caenorhabditis bovis]|uniref:Major sperm protein n=1 Tax=Caenorhabditis bovis TaxID=2654633 RepID=A0A8S1ENN4_9PELO|nr:unnamed protein product [Caenorhabditis bovis]